MIIFLLIFPVLSCLVLLTAIFSCAFSILCQSSFSRRYQAAFVSMSLPGLLEPLVLLDSIPTRYLHVRYCNYVHSKVSPLIYFMVALVMFFCDYGWKKEYVALHSSS